MTNSLAPQPDAEPPLDVIPVIGSWVKGGLIAVAAALVAVFCVAIYLNPYEESDGVTPLRMETHRRLGLPPCTFKTKTNLPCPSCGMTTSFSLLVRGNLWASLQANAVGTLLAIVCLAMIPWSVASVLASRPLFILSIERAAMCLVIGFLALTLIRWAIVLALFAIQ